MNMQSVTTIKSVLESIAGDLEKSDGTELVSSVTLSGLSKSSTLALKENGVIDKNLASS